MNWGGDAHLQGPPQIGHMGPCLWFSVHFVAFAIDWHAESCTNSRLPLIFWGAQEGGFSRTDSSPTKSLFGHAAPHLLLDLVPVPLAADESDQWRTEV